MRFGSILVAVLPVVALANPSVTITSVTQDFPWSGKVKIAYTVSGAEGAGATWAMDFKGQIGGGTPFALSTFIGIPSAENGNHVAVWDSSADGAVFGTDPFVASAKVHRSDFSYDGEYMVIDVSGGNAASSYPVTFQEAESSATFNVDAYKTDKIVLKKVKAGTFLMGSPVDEPGRNETLYNKYSAGIKSGEDQHWVKLTKDFFLGVFPVTQKQFVNVSTMDNPSFAISAANADHRPVERVIYNTHVTGSAEGGFLPLLNAKAMRGDGTVLVGFEVPTESQYEYAQRAGTTTA